MRLIFLTGILFFLTSCGKDEPVSFGDTVELKIPEGFPQPVLNPDNPLTKSKIALGKKLFFEKLISSDGSISCASCHMQEHAFSEPEPISSGVGGLTGFRNAMPLFNLAWSKHFFRDGGVNLLVLAPLNAIDSHVEFNTTLPSVLNKLNLNPEYRLLFQTAFGDSATSFTFLRAMAAFQLTLISGNSRYDKYINGEKDALSINELRGKDLFFSSRTNCSNCHSGFNFTSSKFESNGLFEQYADTGRQRITTFTADRGKFSVPSLRNISVTGPYMHDGSIPDLNTVIERYNSGGTDFFNKNPIITPLNLSNQEKQDLAAFLRTLEDREFIENAEFKP